MTAKKDTFRSMNEGLKRAMEKRGLLIPSFAKTVNRIGSSGSSEKEEGEWAMKRHGNLSIGKLTPLVNSILRRGVVRHGQARSGRATRGEARQR